MKETSQEEIAGMIRQLERIADELMMYREKAEQIKLNVLLITYNHEAYIEESLKSILAQHTDFRFNIIVADDCSTDSTLERIRKIEASTDIPFVYLRGEKNLGIKENYRRAFQACSAEYVAIMEGDDIWQDPYRLQKHVSFLEEHLECSMSFNQYIVKDFEKDEMHVQPVFASERSERFRLITGYELAYDNLIGNFSTCVYRTAYLKLLPEEYYHVFAYDWLLNILISQMGYIGCLLQPMSIYRIHTGSAWSNRKDLDRCKALYDVIDTYDAMTNREFTLGFLAHKRRLAEKIQKESTKNESREKNQDVQNKPGIKRRLKRMIIAFRWFCMKVSDSLLPPIVTRLILCLIPPRILRKIVNMREG